MNTRDRKRAKIRNTIKGTSKRPRLVVFRSNRYVYAQLVDDSESKTLVSVERKEDAKQAGAVLAKKALEKKIASVVFDRAGYRYHGKVKTLADSAREGGLKF